MLVPLAADAVEVKLINTGRMTWNIFDYGYWIEYEIDGKRFRSDTDAGQRTNQLAWELMSEEDKLKVIRAYDMGGIKDVEWALRDGTSTANDWIRSMGCGSIEGLSLAKEFLQGQEESL
ncbi:MAG: hypothetical protein Q4G65_14535 [bacterium]|nr:hypothetical protein [bacterium]